VAFKYGHGSRYLTSIILHQESEGAGVVLPVQEIGTPPELWPRGDWTVPGYAAESRASEDGTDSASNFHKLDFTSTNQDVISDGQTSGRHSEERNCTSDVWKRVARVMPSSVLPVPSAAKWAHGRHLQ
jgi:hypothetical protein